MAVIIKKIKLQGSKSEIEKKAIFDSDSSYSCIHPDLAKKLATVVHLPEPMEFRAAEDGRKVTANDVVILDFYIDKYRFSDEFMVVGSVDKEVIIGEKTLRKWRLKLDFDYNKIIIDPRVTKLRI
jgi:hypothetical protein